MILRSHGANLAYRMAEWGNESIIPQPGAGFVSLAGEVVTTDYVFGLPAAMQAIRLSSTTVASLELAVFRGEGADKERVEPPPALNGEAFTALDTSEFNWLSDMQAGVEGFNNAFARKIRDTRSRLVALDPIHPSNVHVRRENGAKVYDIWTGSERLTGLTSRDVFHLRGFSIGPGVAAPSPVQIHRNSFGVALAQESFIGDHFRNDPSPSTIFRFPGGVTTAQAQEWVDKYETAHSGRGNRRRATAIGGGADVTTLPISLRDAQFIEGQAFSVEQIARIFNWPAWALDKTEQTETMTTTEEKTSQLLVFYLLPRLRRFAAALKSDPDLFGASELYPEFLTDHFIHVDAKTRSEVEHNDVQSGLRLRDEIRADHGLPPLPDGVGQIPQVTPVGGAPNPDPLPQG